ncbi:MAG: polyketide synthase dehydratase domain-containing protein, partial [Desulfobacterales bacterium]|nr:polyketide synthase dehydratase domain-containing protein [Desulfobacterales bacterium]
ERYWIEPSEYHTIRVEDAPHPFLALRVRTANPTWNSILNLEVYDYLKDHVVQEHSVFPASAYLETALAAGTIIYPDKPLHVEDVDFMKTLFFSEAHETPLYQISVNPQTDAFEISSSADHDTGEWTLHCKGKLRVASLHREARKLKSETLVKNAERVMSGETVYRASDILGIRYGALFRGIEKVFYHPMNVLAEIRVPDQIVREFKNYKIHPALLDYCFQTSPAAVPDSRMRRFQIGYIPVYCASFRLLHKPEGNRFYCHTRLTDCGGKMLRANICLYNADGELVAEVRGFESQAAVRTKESRTNSHEECLYENAWKHKNLTETKKTDSASFLPMPKFHAISHVQQTRIHLFNAAVRPLCSRFLTDAFKQLGVQQPNQLRRATSLRHLGIKKLFDPWFKSIVRRHENSGLIADRAISWSWNSSECKKSAIGESFETIIRRFPDAYPELILLQRNGSNLHKILQGRKNVRELLEPDGSLTLDEHFFRDSLTVRAENASLQQSLRGLIPSVPRDHTLNVLIVGGGSGGTVAYLLPEFDPITTHVVFMDQDAERLSRAEHEFFDYQFVEFHHGRITDRKHNKSAIKKNTFDLIIVFDRARNEALSHKGLKRLHAFIKPDGLLILQTRLTRPIWFDLTFFLANTEEEYHTAQSSPETADEVKSRLAENGFSEITHRKTHPIGCDFFAARVPTKQLPPSRPQVALAALHHRAPTAWILFLDDGGFCRKLEHQLIARSRDIIVPVERGSNYRKNRSGVYCVRPGEHHDFLKLIRDLQKRYTLNRVRLIYGWSLDTPTAEDLSDTSLKAAEKSTTASLLGLAHALNYVMEQQPAGLTIFTRGAQAVKEGEKGLQPAQATVLGLGRTFMNEYQKVRIQLIDLPPRASRWEVDQAARELHSQEPEDEIAFRGKNRFVSRFLTKSLAPKRLRKKAPGYRLEFLTPGMLDSLAFVETSRRAPGTGEVRVLVHAAALNFRDILKVLDIYPSYSDRDLLVGDECSGVIERVGPGVHDWKKGDEVVVLGAGCFASSLTIPTRLVLPKPDHMTFEEAATLPVSYLTAYYALCHIGDLKESETVLIQAGTGGLGLAALQVARLIGANVIATAGNPEKRAFLHALGVKHVFDSRSISFAEDVICATSGR